MLNIENLTKLYGGKQVIDGLNWELRRAEIHGLVGLNGAGKTTLFNLLAKVIRFDQGSILLNNLPVHAQDIAYMETENYFYPMLTAKEYLRVFKQTNPLYSEQTMLNLFHLPSNQLIENFSSGMKKRLAMVALLKQDKKCYLFDEPFNGVDLEGGLIFREIFLQLKERGKIVIISSHIIEPLEKIADHIAVLQGGKIQHTFTSPDFEGLYPLIQKHVMLTIDEKMAF